MRKNLNLNPKVCHIQYAPVSDIEKVNIVLGYCKVIFRPGKVWLDFYTTPGSIDFEFPQDIAGGNTIYKQKLTAFFPGLDSSNVKDLFNSDATLYIVKLTMNSGVQFIMGDKENPSQYGDQFGTGKGGRSINLWCNSADPPFPYQE